MVLKFYLIFYVGFLYFEVSHTKWCPDGTIDIYGRKVCDSISLRSRHSLDEVCDCTIIEGFLDISQFYKTELPKNFSFPKLQEVAEYILMYQILSVPSLSQVFPKLAVIRGEKLIHNYAFVMTKIKHFGDTFLPALKVIGRGEALIMPEEIFQPVLQSRWKEIVQDGGPSTYVGKEGVCLTGMEATQNISIHNDCPIDCPRNCNSKRQCCHEECLGGCTHANTSSSCFVCQHVHHLGVCQPKCPDDKYTFRHECVNRNYCEGNSIINDDIRECYPTVSHCPTGYRVLKRKNGGTCAKCVSGTECMNICNGAKITTVAEAQLLRGCHVINGSLKISAKGGQFMRTELELAVRNITKVYGYILMQESGISSLEIFRSLETIVGDELHERRYSLVIESNSKLSNIDATQNTINVMNGSVLIKSNPYWCPENHNGFQSRLHLNHNNQTIQFHSNGFATSCRCDGSFSNNLTGKIEILSCYSITLNLTVELTDRHDRVALYLHKSNKIAFSYALLTKIAHENLTNEDIVCPCDARWVSTMHFSGRDNITITEVDKLSPSTRYVFLVKAFPTHTTNGSIIITRPVYVTTAPYNPPPPQILGNTSNSSSLTISWIGPSMMTGIIDHFNLTLKKLPRDTMTGIKNFCPKEDINSTLFTRDIQLHFLSQKNPESTYSKFHENSSIKQLVNGIIRDDQPLYSPPIPCKGDNSFIRENGKVVSASVTTKNLEYTFNQLESFGLYEIQIFACLKPTQCPKLPGELCKLCSFLPEVSVIRIKEEEGVDMVTFFEVIPLDSHPVGHLELKWKAPEKPNAPVFAYFVEIRDISYSMLKVVKCIKPSKCTNEATSVKGLKPGQYEVRILTISAVSEMVFTSWEKFTIRATESTGKSILIMFGVLAIVVIPTLIVLFQLRKRFKKASYLLPLYESRIEKTNALETNKIINKLHKRLLIRNSDLSLLDCIHNGKFRAIYRGHLERDGQQLVAIKIPAKDFSVRGLQGFLNEAVLIQNIDCSNIIKLLGVVVENNQFKYIMEYAAEKDLRSFLRAACITSTIPHLTLIRLVSEVSAGMTYLHHAGIVHRNLSASNCLLTENLTVKISGFEFAFQPSTCEKLYSIYGPCKRGMAPESIITKSIFTFKTDVWSFGVLLWEMSSGGRKPYSGKDEPEVISAIRRGGSLEIPQCTIPVFRPIIKCCWQYKPSLRPAFCELLATFQQLLPETHGLDGPSLPVDEGCRHNSCRSGSTDGKDSGFMDSSIPSDRSLNLPHNLAGDRSVQGSMLSIDIPGSTTYHNDAFLSLNHPIPLVPPRLVDIERSSFMKKEDPPLEWCFCTSPVVKQRLHFSTESPLKNSYKLTRREWSIFPHSVTSKADKDQFERLLNSPESPTSIDIGKTTSPRIYYNTRSFMPFKS